MSALIATAIPQIVVNSQLARVLTIAINGNQFFRVTDIISHLGYKSSIPAGKLRDDYKCRLYKFKDLVPNKEQQKQLCSNSQKYTASGLCTESQFTDFGGLRTIILRCTRKSAAITACAQLKLTSVSKHCIQARIEHLLIPYFNHWDICMEHEKTVTVEGSRFRIDMYLPQFRVAIEIDEHGHADRDPVYEQKRQQLLEKNGYYFVRMNPHLCRKQLNIIVANFWRTSLYPVLNQQNSALFVAARNRIRDRELHKYKQHLVNIIVFVYRTHIVLLFMCIYLQRLSVKKTMMYI
jgi:hypothetical protein